MLPHPCDKYHTSELFRTGKWYSTKFPLWIWVEYSGRGSSTAFISRCEALSRHQGLSARCRICIFSAMAGVDVGDHGYLQRFWISVGRLRQLTALMAATLCVPVFRASSRCVDSYLFPVFAGHAWQFASVDDSILHASKASGIYGHE